MSSRGTYAVGGMGKLEKIKNEGPLVYKWNTQDHRPPHFHVKHKEGKWEIRVFFQDCSETKLVYNFKWPKHYTPETHPIESRLRDQILEQMNAVFEDVLDPNGNVVRRKSFQEVLYEEWDKKVLIDDFKD